MAANPAPGLMSWTSGTRSCARSFRNPAWSNDWTKSGASGRSRPAARSAAASGGSSGVPRPAK
jgi:hypothetical protein